MIWEEIKIHTTYEAIEPIVNVLETFNITGIVVKEPIKNEQSVDSIYELNPDDYPETGVYVIFYLLKDDEVKDTLQNIKEKINYLTSFGIDLGENKYYINSIEEKDWANEWKKYYYPVKVTENITITPTWEKYKPKSEDEVIIKLDPGMAFGTGTHQTTRLCIEALEKYLKQGSHVIDVGCGSGILSIVSAKLGAKTVLSLDVDPLAIKSTKYNAQLNDVEELLTIKQNSLLENIYQEVDLIVSNILAEIIIQFPKEAYNNLKKGGIFITSGIIQDKEDLVKKHLIDAGFTIKEIWEKDHWISIIAEKCTIS